MGGTIIHTQAKEFIAGTGKKRTTGRYGPKIRDTKQEIDDSRFLHWTTGIGEEKNDFGLLRKQSNMVEALVILLKKTLASPKTPYGLSLESAECVAREAGFKGGKEVVEAVDRAGACLIARMPEKYMFKGDLVLAKRF